MPEPRGCRAQAGATATANARLECGVVAAHRYGWDEGAVAGKGVTIAVCTRERPSALVRFLDSLAAWEGARYPVLLVDASRGTGTEAAVRSWVERRRGPEEAIPLAYFRVQPPLSGLTRQRNFALDRLATPLVCFFDDDVELVSRCVSEMERVFQEARGSLAGVGALVVNQPRRPSRLWRLRRALGVVAHLHPGSYHGSGFSVPWGYVPDDGDAVTGDWLPGAAMLWEAAAAREVRFCEDFAGYSQAEDLEFSVRMSARGKLALSTRARVKHWEAAGGRERSYPLGYMAIRNRYHVHRLRFDRRHPAYKLWFAYAWLLDSVLLIRNFVYPRRVRATLAHLRGRLAASRDLLVGKRDRLTPATLGSDR